MGISYVKNFTFRTRFHCFSKSQIVKKVLNVWWITNDCVVAITVCAQISVITPNIIHQSFTYADAHTIHQGYIYLKKKQMIRSTSI